MDSVVSAALSSAVKSGTEVNRGAGEASRAQKKSARISELPPEGTIREKLAALDTAETAAAAAGARNGSGSDSLESPSVGAISGRQQWRKLNKAVVATKVLASRPKALSQGRHPARQALAQQQQLGQPSAGIGRAGGGGKGSDPDTLDFLLSPGQRLRRRLGGLLQDAGGYLMNRMVIMPETRWYHVWWFYYAVTIAIISCWVEPFQMAFEGLHATGVWMRMIEYVILVTFVVDFLLKFCVAYFDPESGMLVTTQPRMAVAYCRSIKFFLDILGCFPYDMMATAIAARCGVSDSALQNMDWLKLLALSRAYRVFDLFHVLDYRMMLSQATLMLLRNYIYVFFTAHWAACIFFHMAREEGNAGSQGGGSGSGGARISDVSWVGRNAEVFMGRPLYEQYILSLYFSVTIFTSMGDGRLYPFTILELSVMIIYLMFNLFLGAYIIGTVTIMMVRADEHSKAFRESMSHLLEYSRDNELPDRLQKAMREHLEVHFDSAQTADDAVLSIYPTTIRRLALRHLYLAPVRNCYIFKGCKQRFLDALLTAARVELFLPGVEIMTEGDNVVELLVVVLGECLVSRAGQRIGGVYGNSYSVGALSGASAAGGGVSAAASGAAELTASFFERGGGGSRPGSVEGSFTPSVVGSGGGGRVDSAGGESMSGPATPLLSPGGITLLPPGGTFPLGPRAHVANLAAPLRKGPSDALAEVAFFTDGASYETVVGATPVRVLSLPKAAWELLVQQFPQQAKLVLDNVQLAAEAAVEDNLRQAAARHQLTSSQLHAALSLVGGTGGFADSTDPILLAQTRDALTHHQMEMITRLDDVRTVAAAHTRKCDEMRTFEFLNTAAQGDVESLRTMLTQGISPNTADYDGRTGLMLAAAKGHHDTVQLLLNAGADKDKTDAFGISALAEAVKNAHDDIIELLLKYGSTLGAGGLTVAAEMCTAVYNNDLVKLRRLLRSGAPPDACDYDKRSALHIAGAEGNLPAVKLLVEEGGADPGFQDRWGNTPLDEARRVGATPVVAYLESRQRRDAGGRAEKRRQLAAHEFMGWCGSGEVSELRTAGGFGFGEEAGCGFAGLLLAASKGHTEVVELLLEGLPSEVLRNHAHVAMLEAARMGHPETVRVFRAAGVTLILTVENNNSDPRVGHVAAGGGGSGAAGRSSSPPSPSLAGAATTPCGGSGSSCGRLMRGLLADLRAAAQSGSGLVLEALLAAGVPGQRRSGEANSPLHLAAEHGHLGVVRRLLEHGGAVADLTAPDGLGRTPLQLAERLVQQRPHDVHARGVYAYLAWATPLAVTLAAASPTATARGGGGGGGVTSAAAQLAAAAAERWGPVGHAAVDTHAADVAVLLGAPGGGIGGAAGGGKRGGLLRPLMGDTALAAAASTTGSGGGAERLMLPRRPHSSSSSASPEVPLLSHGVNTSGGDGENGDLSGLFPQQEAAAAAPPPPPLLLPLPEEPAGGNRSSDAGYEEGEDPTSTSAVDVTPIASAFKTSRSSSGLPSSGGGAAAAGDDAAAASLPGFAATDAEAAAVELPTPGATPVVMDVLGNLPGTPGGSMRGAAHAATLLAALPSAPSGTGGGGGGADPAEAALLFNATVMHSAALLNEPPPTSGRAAAATTAAAAAGGNLSPVVGVCGGGGGGLASPLPGASTSSNPGGLGSPCLILPPARATAVLPPPGSPGDGGCGDFSRANSISSRSAASRLFGGLGPGGLLASPPMAADDAAAGGGGGSSGSGGSSRAGSAAAMRRGGVASPAAAAAARGGGGGVVTASVVVGQPYWRRLSAGVLTSPVVGIGVGEGVEDEIERYVGGMAHRNSGGIAAAAAGLASPGGAPPVTPGAVAAAAAATVAAARVPGGDLAAAATAPGNRRP